MRQRFLWGVIGVLAVHFVAAGIYAARFPPWRAPDEGAHFAYILHLARTQSLPVFEGMGRGATYEAHQPPLYYLTSLPIVAPLLRSEGHHQIALYVLRGISTLWGALVVLCAMGAAWLLCPHTLRLSAALTAGLFAALLPMHLLVCASVSNDAAAGATAAAAWLWLCFVLLRPASDHRAALRRAFVAGALSGGALLTKSSNLIVVPLALIAVALAPVQRGGLTTPSKPTEPRQRPLAATVQWQSPVACLAAFLMTAGWWLWRNTVLYGDPLAVRAFLEGFATSPKPNYFLEQLGLSLPTYLLMVAQVTLFTWLGVFGEPNEAVKGLGRLMQGTEPTLPFVILCALIGALLLVGIGLGSVATVRQSWCTGTQRAWAPALAVVLPVLMTLLVFAEFIQFNRHFFQAQARYFYPAHAAMAVLFAVGVVQTVPTHRLKWGVVGSASLLAVLSATVGWLWVPLPAR